jgi:EAL domain-containing protein (putative c-di-GMP-specific phosphodiesterase class I)
MKKLALLIGVGEHEYPECLANLSSPGQDVASLHHVLSESKWGNFDRVDCLLHPDRYEMEKQIARFFQNCGKEDLLLLYFSGHGLQDHLGNLHLATRITHKSAAGQLMRSSTVSAQTINKLIGQSPSQYQVVVLDCCFSGAFEPALQPKDAGDLNLKALGGAPNRVVLTSSGADQYSFEHKDQARSLSLYTRYLVEGIETGAADLHQIGQIPLADLHNYASQRVRRNWPTITPQILASQDNTADQIVIANSNVSSYAHASIDILEQINTSHLKLAKNKCGSSCPDDPEFPPLPNPLAMYEALIQRLIEHLQADNQLADLVNHDSIVDTDLRSYLLKSLCSASYACYACIWQANQQDEWQVTAQSDDNKPNYLIWISEILPRIAYGEIFSPYGTGILHFMGDHIFVFIPLQIAPHQEFLVIGLPQTDRHLLQEPYGVIAATFCQLSKALVVQSDRAEAALLDGLKRTFGFVSPHLYDRRFQLFRERLQKMVVYFQPIVQLQPIKIIAWEALARDPSNGWTTPTDLFTAAELWGPQFTTVLDLYFLKAATESYNQEYVSLNLKRADDVVPLAVNVYPNSLLRNEYFNAVKSVFDRGVVEPGNLILEISEKAALPKSPPLPNSSSTGNNDEPEWVNFKERLKNYHRKHIKVRFAIDDFGVGYASMSRLLGLQLDYVKIDPEILHHAKEVSGKALQFVRDVLIESNYSSSTIIVEGVDENCSVSLSELKSFGVNSIQGFMVDKALEHIYHRLSLTQRDRLKSKLDKPCNVY